MNQDSNAQHPSPPNEPAIECATPLDSTFSIDTTLRYIQGFDIDDLVSSCAPIYFGLHLHFFLEDDCSGGLQPANLDGVTFVNPCQADTHADSIVDALNASHETMSNNPENYNYQWNSEDWGAPESDPQCVPFRFYLEGVHIHCDSEIRHKTGESLTDYDPFVVDGTNTFNIFIADVDLNCCPTATGYTFLGDNRIVVQDIYTEHIDNLLSHELGHTFGLRHTFDDFEKCDDTWGHLLKNHPDSWRDVNCNGTMQVDEDIISCFSNYDGEDFCDTNVCDYNPCCQWHWQDNNVMTNSAWASNPTYSAFTDCQITRAITGIGQCHGNRIKSVDPDCISPAAVITNNPVEDQLLFLLASSGEDEYKVDIQTLSGGTITTTGWRNGPAQHYVHDPHPNLIVGNEYKAVLTVKNQCNEDIDMATFIQPVISEPRTMECVELVSTYNLGLSVIPNPAGNENIGVNFTLPFTSEYRIYRIPITTSEPVLLLYESPLEVTGQQSQSFNISSWQSGMHGIYVLAGNVIDSKTLIKSE